jgi:hypothetical protein
LTGRYTTPDGRNHHFAAAHLESRARITAASVAIGPDGQPQPDPPSPWPNRFALAATHPDVDEVLEIMGRPEPLGWLELRKIHEIICRSIEPTTTAKLGWTTSNRDETFTSSASNPAISGSDAIHARPPKGNQPKRKMFTSEGRQYVSDLVTNWLDYLI